MFDSIKKRDGRIIEFNSSKITSAIARAGKVTAEFGEGDEKNTPGKAVPRVFGVRVWCPEPRTVC